MHQWRWVRLLLAAGLVLAACTALWAAPTPADKSFEAAKMFMSAGNDQQAAEEFQHFLEAFPNDPRSAQAAFLLGCSYQRLQKPDKAIEAFTRVFAKVPANDTAEFRELRARTHYQMGACYLSKPDYGKAERAYYNFLQLCDRVDPFKDEAQGKIWKDMKVNAQYRRAESLYQLDRREESYPEYQKVLTFAPKDPLAPWACYMMGIIKNSLNDPATAITTLERFTTEFKDSEIAGEAMLELGIAYLARGRAQTDAARKADDFTRAITLLDTAVQAPNVTPQSKQKAALILAEAYFERGDLAKSDAAYTKALELIEADKKDSELALQTRLQRAHVLYNAKRYDEARKEYQKISDSKTSPAIANEALFWLALCIYNLPEKKDLTAYRTAVSALTRFLANPGEKDPKAPQAALLLAYNYEDLADLGEKDAIQKAVDTYSMILRKWRGSDAAAQAQAGISRLSPKMTPQQLQALATALPQGAMNWDVTLQIAYKEFTAGQYANAIEAAKKTIAAKPEAGVEAQAAYLVGASLQRQGQTNDAIPYYQQVLAVKPDGDLVPYAMRALVQAYLDKKDYPNARDTALKLIQQKPISKTTTEIANEQAERHMYLAMAYHNCNQLADARTTYGKLVHEYPASPLAPVALINYAQLVEKDDIQGAIEAYRKFIATYPEHELVSDVFLALGAALARVKEYDQAIAAYQNVPDTYKLADQAAYAIAVIYKSQPAKEFDAIKQFEVVTTKFPNSRYAVDSWYRIGEYLMVQKKYADAVRAFTESVTRGEALKLTRDDSAQMALSTFNLASCAYLDGQYAAAADAFAKVTTNYPTSEYAAASLFWQGQALEKLGGDVSAKAARDAYAKYLAKSPKGELAADAAVGVGRATLAAKQYDVARADLQKATDICAELEKGDNEKLAERAKSLAGEVQYWYAQTYYDEKNYKVALKEFAAVSAFKYEPWYSLSALQVARCNAALGDKENALNALKVLVKTLPDSDGAKQATAVAKELGLEL